MRLFGMGPDPEAIEAQNETLAMKKAAFSELIQSNPGSWFALERFHVEEGKREGAAHIGIGAPILELYIEWLSEAFDKGFIPGLPNQTFGNQ